MKSITLASAGLSLLFTACAAAAATYLDRVESPVFEATGDHQAITKRAITCIAQIVKPGSVNATTITSSDPEAGIVVARNGFIYSSGSFISAKFQGRSTLTFQAKDGRFRIIHTSIEMFNESINPGWQPIGTWSFSGGDDAKDAMDAISQSVATCVKAPPAANDNW